MADVFISYKAERREAAQHLASVLGAYGYSVWWDYALVAGSDFTRQIETELEQAKAVIVLWCALSRDSEWVRQEAMFAKSRRKIVPVFMEAVEPPFGFQMDHTVSLAGWDGAPADEAALAPLLRELARLTARAPQRDAEAVRQAETTWRAAGAPSLTDFALGPKLERAALPFSAPRRRGLIGWLISPIPLAIATSVSVAAAAIALWPQQHSQQVRQPATEQGIVATAVDPAGLNTPSAPARPQAAMPTAQSQAASAHSPSPEDEAPISAPRWLGPCALAPFNIYFAYDNVHLSDAAKNALEDALLRSRRCNITAVRIVGHDETEASPSYSMGVSERRASAVRDFLVEQGAPIQAIVTEARGQYALAVETGPGVREPLNRRVTVEFEMSLRE